MRHENRRGFKSRSIFLLLFSLIKFNKRCEGQKIIIAIMNNQQSPDFMSHVILAAQIANGYGRQLLLLLHH